jgi:hypothetical protein
VVWEVQTTHANSLGQCVMLIHTHEYSPSSLVKLSFLTAEQSLAVLQVQ